MGDEAKFCILKVVKHLENSLRGDDDVLMDEYLAGYTELNKFFALMGKVFGFVSSDVNEKVMILQAFRAGTENKDKFETFKTMLEYEKDGELLEKKGYVSGSRTLLRLHRGLGTCRLLSSPVSPVVISNALSRRQAYGVAAVSLFNHPLTFQTLSGPFSANWARSERTRRLASRAWRLTTPRWLTSIRG